MKHKQLKEKLPIFGKTDLPSFVSKFTPDDISKCLHSASKQAIQILKNSGVVMK